MAQSVHPTQEDASSQLTSGAIKWAGLGDWVVPSGTDYLAAFDGLSGTPLNGFEESHTADSFDVTVDTGEAFVGGRWMAKDQTTTVSLASGTNNQTVYAGWESSTANSVIIGLDSAFSSTDDGRRTEIWEFDTDASGVTASRKVHENEPIHPHARTADELGDSAAEDYARVDQSETISAAWAWNANISMNGNAINSIGSMDSDTIDVDDSGDGWRLGQGSEGSNLTPLVGGDFLWSDNFKYLYNDGIWDFGTGVDINGGLAVRLGGSHIELEDTDDGQLYRVEVQSGGWRVVEPGVEEWLEIDPDQGHRLEAPGGMATQHHRLAPRSSEPPVVQNGTMAVQDGSGWDPAGTGELDLVVYLGGWQLAT